jgi:cyanate lyase
MADIYGNVSAAGGFDESEIEFVTNLINTGQVSVADVAKEFGLPESVVSAAYEANRPAVEPATIERLNHHQTAPGSLSPAATTTITSPFLPDATYNIPGFSLPDYRYNDTSSSGGGLSGGTGGGLTNYVTAVEPARSGPEGYTGPSISALPPGGGLGPGEYSLGNTTLDRGIRGGGSLVDRDSSLFHQDLKYQDDEEARRDVDYLNHLAKWQAHEDKTRLLANAASPEGGFDEGEIAAVTALLNSNAVTVEDISRQFDVPIDVVQAAYDANKPVQSTQAAYDAILEDIAAAIKNEGIVTENLQATTADRAGALDPNFTASQAAIASGVGGLTTAKQNTKDAIDAALASGVVDQGDIDDAFGPTFAETALEGLSNVLGAGTRGIYNVASNIPVVGGYLEDAIEGFAGWLKNTEGTVSANPITRQVSGVWGEIPPWVKTEALTKIGPIPNSKTTAGINSGTIIDDIISIGRGERDIGDVLEDRAEQAASILGIDPKILAAAAAAGMSVKDYLEAQKPKQTTLGTTTEGETEAGVKPVAVDLGGGPNKEGGEEEDIVDTLTEAQEKEKNLATATQVFEDAGGGAEGVQAVLDTLKENDLTVADLADLTGLNETDINAFIDTTLGDGADVVDTLTEAQEKEKNLATATQVFEDAGGGADGVQAVLDTLKENDLTVADLADLTGLNETDINAFIDTTLGDTTATDIHYRY